MATFFFRRASVKAYELARERVSAVNADLQESVSGLRILQAFRRERDGRRHYTEGSESYRSARIRGQWLISVYFPFVQLLSSVAAAAVLMVGAHRVDAGTLTTGALVAYLLYIDLFFAPVQQLSQVFDGYQQATVSLGRIQELLREPTTTKEAAEPVEVRSLRGDIAFDGVDFAYGDDEEALSGIDLTIPAGQTVAFVGETGAGKSTLVKLVARFYDPRAVGYWSTAPMCARWSCPRTGTGSVSSRRRRISSRGPCATPSPTAGRTPPTPTWRPLRGRSARTR